MMKSLLGVLRGTRVLSKHFVTQKTRFCVPHRTSSSTTNSKNEAHVHAVDENTGVHEKRLSMYMNPNVQTLLQNLTHLDPHRANKARKLGRSYPTPKYEFLTQEELDRDIALAYEKAKTKLAVPPVMSERKPIDEIISDDPELQGLDESSFVFTDITFGISDRNRLIVVREPNGILRKGTWEERDRMNRIYFPRDGQDLLIPRMFQDEHLQKVLERFDYEFILDRACAQFEPDDPMYIRVVHATYIHLDQNNHYDMLRSTRHFAPMVFYLALTKQLDNFLLYSVKMNSTADIQAAIQLFALLYPESKTAELIEGLSDPIKIIKIYVENDCQQKAHLHLAVQALAEIHEQKPEVLKDMGQAHGV